MNGFPNETRDELIAKLLDAKKRLKDAEQEREALAEQVRLERQRLGVMLSIMPCGISIASDPSCKDIRHNPVAAEFLRIKAWDSFSFSAENVPPVRVYHQGQEVAPDDMPIQRAAWLGELVNRLELEYQWPDGIRKIAECSAMPLCGPQGSVVGVIATINDITERKKSEEELRQHRDHLQVLVSEQTAEIEKKHHQLTAVFTSINDRLLTIIDQCPVGVVVVNQHGIIEAMNKMLRNALPGESWRECQGQSYFDIIAQVLGTGREESPMYWALLGRPTIDQALRRGGRDWIVSVKPIQEGAKITGAIGVFQDVTEAKQRDRERMEALILFHDIFHHSFVAMAVSNLETGQIVDVNPAWEQLTGYSKQEAIGQNGFHRSLLDMRTEEVQQTYKDYLANGFVRFRSKLKTKEGLYRWTITSATIVGIRGEQHNLISLIDITDQIALEAEITRRENEYRTIVENHPCMIIRMDRQGRPLYMSPSAARHLGGQPACYLGKPLEEMGYPLDKRTVWQEKINAVFESGVEISFELETTNANGMLRHFQVRMAPEKDEAGVIQSLISVATDVTTYKQAEERFAKAFHAHPAMMAIRTLYGDEYVDVNDSYAQALGRSRSELIGRPIGDLHLWADSEERNQAVSKIMETGSLRNVEMRYRTGTGEIRQGTLSGEVIVLGDQQCILSVLNDITDKRRLEEEMARLDRLNLVGEMAAGIGHEVRNPMTTVRGYLQMFQMKAELSKYHSQFDVMIEELDRANGIITEFLSLAKNKAVEKKSVNLNTIIAFLLPMLQADAFRRGHQLYADLRTVPDHEFDEKEIRQLILNLVRNALEAMNSSGEVVIRTYAESDTIHCEVQDTGPGIAPEVITKLGTPFVTTKDNGTGLGLPVCYRIAERHDASIVFDTGPMGTTFAVVFRS